MSTPYKFIPEVKYYDFHIYYQTHKPVSRDVAVKLRDTILSEFANEVANGDLVVKILRDNVVGPHITNFFEVDVQNPNLFVYFYTWLNLNKNGLDVLIHPNTGNSFRDHVEYPVWFGNKLPLITEGILHDRDGEISPYGLLTRQPNEIVEDGKIRSV